MVLKLSIIVPVYKVEDYLYKCVDSLLNQDLSMETYEIILVNDGSPDRCGDMCDEIAAKNSNVKVVHRVNGGLSAARNSGIDVAKGEYVQFVDSDDYIEPKVLKGLVEKMDHEGLDVLRFNYQNVNERYEVITPNKDPKHYVDYSDEVCDGLTFLNERLGPACYAWQFIVRRELLEDCRFKEGIYFEDTEWTPRLMLKAKQMTSVGLIVYNYLLRQGSITQSVDEKKKKKVLDDLLLSIDSLQQLMYNVADKRWLQGMITMIVLSVFGYVVSNCSGEQNRVTKLLKTKGVFPLSTFHISGSNRRKVRIANFSPFLLFLLLRYRGR